MLGAHSLSLCEIYVDHTNYVNHNPHLVGSILNPRAPTSISTNGEYVLKRVCF